MIKIMRNTPKARDVKGYISAAPKNVRGQLREMRTAIRESAPMAEERISYGMPYYGYKGRLAYFAIAKKHIGLYLPPSTIVKNKKELKKYQTSKATIRFSLEEKLPIALIKKLIKESVKSNELRGKK